MTEMTATERRLEREPACLPRAFLDRMSIALTGNNFLLCLIVFAFLIAIPGAAWSQIVSPSSQYHSSDDYTLRVDANLVILTRRP